MVFCVYGLTASSCPALRCHPEGRSPERIPRYEVPKKGFPLGKGEAVTLCVTDEGWLPMADLILAVPERVAKRNSAHRHSVPCAAFCGERAHMPARTLTAPPARSDRHRRAARAAGEVAEAKPKSKDPHIRSPVQGFPLMKGEAVTLCVTDEGWASLAVPVGESTRRAGERVNPSVPKGDISPCRGDEVSLIRHGKDAVPPSPLGGGRLLLPLFLFVHLISSNLALPFRRRCRL